MDTSPDGPHLLPDVLVGHDTDARRPTGVTVVLLPDGTTAGVDVRGAAPGTRETDVLDPVNTVDVVHAIVLSGGSAFGLDSAGGVMRWLESRGRGLSVGLARVPIVPAAVLFDLGVGGLERPDAASGARACDAAVPLDQAAEGNVGAGAGATVGKSLGPERAMRGGLGIASRTAGGLAMAAVVAVNAVGDVVDPESGAILAGARAGTDRAEPLGTLAVMLGESTRGARASGGGSAGAPANLPGPAGRGPNPGRGLAEDPGQGLAEDPGQGLAQDPGQGLAQDPGQGLAQDPGPGLAQDPGQGLANTTIGVLVTDARLTKAQATRLAQVGHDGLARTIRPVHTPMDGDTLFAAGTGTAAAEPADQATMFLLCALAAEVVAEAVVRGVRAAHGWRGDGLWLPAWRDRA